MIKSLIAASLAAAILVLTSCSSKSGTHMPDETTPAREELAVLDTAFMQIKDAHDANEVLTYRDDAESRIDEIHLKNPDYEPTEEETTHLDAKYKTIEALIDQKYNDFTSAPLKEKANTEAQDAMYDETVELLDATIEALEVADSHSECEKIVKGAADKLRALGDKYPDIEMTPEQEGVLATKITRIQQLNSRF